MGRPLGVTDAWPTRSAAAYQKLRQRILDGSLPGGTLLVEATLVREFGISRTPIREALHRLEAEGMLAALPRGGYSVVALTNKDLHDFYQIRAALEGLAAETAAHRVTRTDIARLEDLYDEMAAALDQDREDDLARLNREFHQAIALASGNSQLHYMLDNLKAVFERFRTGAVSNDERRRQAHHEHGELIEALRARDAATARRLAEQHVHRALEHGIQATTTTE